LGRGFSTEHVGSDSEVSAFSHGVCLALINGHALIEMPRQFRAGNERKWHEHDPEKCPNDHIRRLMIELLFYNQSIQAVGSPTIIF
jgi:hypothetical protein